jgi:dihydropyrimidinase
MMQTFDVSIRGGSVVSSSETVCADVGIRDGKVVALAESIPAEREIDATGLLVLPGGIDSHVHISQPSGPGISMADDFTSATASAAAGGNTLIMPFALQERGESLRGAVESYRQLTIDRCHIDVALHMIVTDHLPPFWGKNYRLLSRRDTRPSRSS